MNFPRRRFLKGLGGALVGLPALSIFSRPAAAQTTPTPKRAVFFWSPNGFNLSTFYPRNRHGGGSSARPASVVKSPVNAQDCPTQVT